MVNELIRYRMEPERTDAFLAAYGEAEKSLGASEHCLEYELSRCTEAPGDFVLTIKWDSLDGHLKGFRASREFGSFFHAVQPFVGNVLEMRHYERVLFGTGGAKE